MNRVNCAGPRPGVDFGDLAAENVDVDVRRSQHHVADLGREPVIADRHLPERFDREVIAHRMRQDRDRVDVRIFDQRLQHRLQRVARIDRAVAVVNIVGHVAAGRPGEQHRRDLDARVVDDLCEAIDSFLKTGVEAVDEDENPAARDAPDARIEVCLRLREIHAIGAQDDEITFWIGRQRGREARRRLAGARRPGGSTRRYQRNPVLVPSILRT